MAMEDLRHPASHRPGLDMRRRRQAISAIMDMARRPNMANTVWEKRTRVDGRAR